MTTVGILGGTGPAGSGVAIRMASAGYDVVLGSRDPSRAAEVAKGLTPRGSGTVSGTANEDAASCDLVSSRHPGIRRLPRQRRCENNWLARPSSRW